jgi:hypothetical protein
MVHGLGGTGIAGEKQALFFLCLQEAPAHVHETHTGGTSCPGASVDGLGGGVNEDCTL